MLAAAHGCRQLVRSECNQIDKPVFIHSEQLLVSGD